MRITINHLTRMSQGYVCAAGVAIDSKGNYSHIRPLREKKKPHNGRLERNCLRSNGGAFSLGSIVDLGPINRRHVVPEIEDVKFLLWKVKHIQSLDVNPFIDDAIKPLAKSSLREIFGEDLYRQSSTAAAVPKGKGLASLGVIGPLSDVELEAREYYGQQEIRFSLSDPDLGNIRLKVTDIRLWESDHITPSFKNIDAIQTRIDGCYISVGLTREYKSRHWLQINNVFPESDPLWTRE